MKESYFGILFVQDSQDFNFAAGEYHNEKLFWWWNESKVELWWLTRAVLLAVYGFSWFGENRKDQITEMEIAYSFFRKVGQQKKIMFSRWKKRRILDNHKLSLPADTYAERYTTLCAVQTSVVDVRRTTLEKAYFRAERQNHNSTFTYYGSLNIEKLLKMGLVRIRHGVAQYAVKSRVRAYKNRAKGSGWQANWREHFCHSLAVKTSFFPLSIRLLFGPITSPTSEIINACSWPGLQPGSRWWCKSLRMPQARMVKLRKEGTPHRFIALWKHSLLSSHFDFLPDKAQGWLHCQIQVQIPILSLLHNLPHFALPGRFGQSLNLLKRDSMACRTPVRKGHRLKVGRVLGRNQFSAAVFLFVFDFF